MPLRAEITTRLTAHQTGSNDFGGPNFDPTIEAVLQFTNGTGAGQADILWADERTINASSNDDLDLAGVLTDAFGRTVAAVELVAIMVVAAATNTNNVVVGAATNPVPLFGGTSPTVPVKPGGVLLLAAPNAAGLATVTASTGDILRVANSGSGSTVTYKIAVLARTA